MRNKETENLVRCPWRFALILGCALLLIFGSTLQITHTHSAAELSHAGCALCATAHAVISPASPLAVLFTARRTSTPVIEEQSKFAHRLFNFSLYKRPPPVAIVSC
jgi:hypothetical protein